MLYEKELRFICEVLRKCHVSTLVMTDEELAVFWHDHHDDYCHANPACLELSDADKEILPAWCERCVLAWLREPADATTPATMTEEDKLHSGLVEED